MTLVCAALATAFLIAPVPFHRIVFRRGMKDDLIVAAQPLRRRRDYLFLFMSMAGAILLVLDFLVDLTVALVVTGGLAGPYSSFCGWWFR